MNYKKTSSIYISITVIAFILINLISMNWFMRFDLTDNKMYSLSNSSKQTVQNIDDPLTIDLYFSDDLPGQLQNNKRYVQDLLEEYAAYSNNINFYFVRNDENFSTKALGDGIQSQDIQVIENDEISFKTIFMGMKIRFGGKSEAIQLLGVNTGLEYMLTKSIKKLTDQKETTIGFAQAGSRVHNNENLNTILSERFNIKSNLTLDNINSSLIDLLIINGIEGDLSDFFNLGALPEVNPILSQLNESSKIIGGKLETLSGGEILLITDSDFFNDESIASMRIVRGDVNENYTFTENIIDVMLGDEELVSLRSREVLVRPLIDSVIGKENSSVRTRWKWIDLLFPSFLIIGYGLIRKRFREKRAKYLMEFYG